MICMSGFFFNGSRGLCASLAESEFRFKQLYFNRSFNFQYMLKKTIKFNLQNIPICSSFKKKKRRKKRQCNENLGKTYFTSFS